MSKESPDSNQLPEPNNNATSSNVQKVEHMGMREYRQKFFQEMTENTRLLSDEDYNKFYKPALELFGHNSPAVVSPLLAALKPPHPHPETIPPELAKTYMVAINKDVIPKEYVEYIKTHEYWEHYIGGKKGFNFKNARAADRKLPIQERKRPAHCFATYKEFQAAEADGQLDEYMEWWRKYYKNDIARIMRLSNDEIEKISKNYGEESGDIEYLIQRVRDNQQLKKEIYEKFVSKRT